MPTGQAQTRRRMPPTADARPKRLPTTSRHRTCWSPNAQIAFGDQHVLWREVVGNLFGLASAVGGMRRRVWAWPVGIVGNVLLFTVFRGSVFGNPQGVTLLGQAGRQVFFIAVSIYGWRRWQESKRQADGDSAPAIVPRWATRRERVGLVVAAGLATYGMARGWTEFWLIWVAVDLVGVPLLLVAGFYPSAVLYAVYGVFVIWGFTVWVKAQRQERPADAGRPDSPAVETVG